MKEWRLISNDVKQVQDIDISDINHWCGGFKDDIEVEFQVILVSIYISFCYSVYSYTTYLVFFST